MRIFNGILQKFVFIVLAMIFFKNVPIQIDHHHTFGPNKRGDCGLKIEHGWGHGNRMNLDVEHGWKYGNRLNIDQNIR